MMKWKFVHIVKLPWYFSSNFHSQKCIFVSPSIKWEVGQSKHRKAQQISFSLSDIQKKTVLFLVTGILERSKYVSPQVLANFVHRTELLRCLELKKRFVLVASVFLIYFYSSVTYRQSDAHVYTDRHIEIVWMLKYFETLFLINKRTSYLLRLYLVG